MTKPPPPRPKCQSLLLLKGELKDEREQNRGPSCPLVSLKVEWPDKEASNLLHGREDGVTGGTDGSASCRFTVMSVYFELVRWHD